MELAVLCVEGQVFEAFGLAVVSQGFLHGGSASVLGRGHRVNQGFHLV